MALLLFAAITLLYSVWPSPLYGLVAALAIVGSDIGPSLVKALKKLGPETLNEEASLCRHRHLGEREAPEGER
jgi:predicted benzoate:H+ symporter BenE